MRGTADPRSGVDSRLREKELTAVPLRAEVEIEPSVFSAVSSKVVVPVVNATSLTVLVSESPQYSTLYPPKPSAVFHYTFTRKVADLLYVKDYGAIRRRLRPARIIAVSIGAVVGTTIAIAGSLGWQAAFTTAMISISWIEMMSVSLLRKFGMIITAYISGMALLILGIVVSGSQIETNTLILIFGFSQGTTVIILASVTSRFLANRRKDPETKIAVDDNPRLSQILWTIGTLLYVVMWFDEFLFWVSFGEPSVLGLPLFSEYDRATFIAQLSTIPGMIFFTVRGETSFSRNIKTVAQSLRSKPYSGVQQSKYRLILGHWDRMSEQILLRLLSILVATLVIPSLPRRLFLQTVIAAHSYLVLYTVIADLLYLVSYRNAIKVPASTFAVLLIGSVLIVLFSWRDSAGISLAIACAFGILYGETLVKEMANDLDRNLLTASIR